MNIHQILNTPIPFTLPGKRKVDSVTSEAESKSLSSPSSRRKVRAAPRKPKPSSPVKDMKGKGNRSSPRLPQKKPLSFKHDTDARTASSSARQKALTSQTSIFISLASPRTKTLLARPLRILSRHVQDSVLASGAIGSLTRIPSIMDVYLDAKSPSIDFTEEVLSEIAARSRQLGMFTTSTSYGVSVETSYSYTHSDPPSSSTSRSLVNNYRQYRLLSDACAPSSSLVRGVSGLSLSGEEQISTGANVNGVLSRDITRHPDSFVRSTATWSEGLNGQ
ncbi:hypothetical protein D9757_001281 [Collybiopsis confluens]|uniref:Uncharacterized protein n=1 Tax=Collybiopsis confluens TaxID=2823264 RepID=A0A8H5I0K5_9AGAR|nr:hypothetical protein D9757_001281 [Collybiopsis confluens]